MITEEQVRKAASRYQRWKSGDSHSPYKSPYFNCDGDDPAYINRDRLILADAYIAELSRRESERAERAKPIDDAWLESIGFRLPHSREEPGLWFGDIVRYNTAFAECVVCNARPSITTRGQLLDLLNALNVRKLG